MNPVQKQWHRVTRLIQEVLDELSSANEIYRVLSPDESDAALAWLANHFPIASWGRILWSDVPASVCVPWAEKGEELEYAFRAMCQTQYLADPAVIVAWSNALAPAVQTSLAAVCRHAQVIFDADFDTWIMCETHGWCIEVYHEGEHCFGRSWG